MTSGDALFHALVRSQGCWAADHRAEHSLRPLPAHLSFLIINPQQRPLLPGFGGRINSSNAFENDTGNYKYNINTRNFCRLGTMKIYVK